MDIERFHILSEPQKCFYAYMKGVHIGSIHTRDALVHLYSIRSYYVEVFYPKAHFIEPYALAFNSTDRLDPYLQAINIEEILANL